MKVITVIFLLLATLGILWGSSHALPAPGGSEPVLALTHVPSPSALLDHSVGLPATGVRSTGMETSAGRRVILREIPLLIAASAYPDSVQISPRLCRHREALAPPPTACIVLPLLI